MFHVIDIQQMLCSNSPLQGICVILRGVQCLPQQDDSTKAQKDSVVGLILDQVLANVSDIR